MKRTARIISVVALSTLGLFGALGCTGYVSDVGVDHSGGSSPASERGPGSSSPGAVPEPTPPAVAAPYRQMTRLEISNTVRTLLGTTMAVEELLAPESPAGRFTRNAFDRNVSEQAVTAYKDLAQALASDAVTNHFDSLVMCSPQSPTDETTCGHAFIRTFGERAFRRPVSMGAQGALERLFDASRTKYGFKEAVALTLQAILQSPNFLYHVEDTVGAPAPSGVASADSYAVAARLSYFMTGTLPDAQLWEAAKAAKLQTPDEVRAQAERLMNGPGFADAAWEFHRQWLRIDDIKALYKNPERVQGWPAESARNDGWSKSLHDFLSYVFSQAQPSLQSLFTSPAVFLPPELGPFYGATQNADGLPVVTGPRFGLLTQPALMAKLAQPDQSNPVKRGLFVLQNVLCGEMPPPPDSVKDQAKPPVLTANMTTRERYQQHSSNAICAACHKTGGFDALGFAFESYDALGIYRTAENGKPIDTSGAYPNFADQALSAPYQNAGELVSRLIASREATTCLTRLWYEYALGRASGPADVGTIAKVEDIWRREQTDLRKLVVAIVTSEAFRTRQVESVQ